MFREIDECDEYEEFFSQAANFQSGWWIVLLWKLETFQQKHPLPHKTAGVAALKDKGGLKLRAATGSTSPAWGNPAVCACS
jgi:hypothetical protein